MCCNQLCAKAKTWWLVVGAVVMFALSFVLEGNDPRAGGRVSVH